MRGNRRRATKPELALRRELHARGARYRVDYPIKLPARRQVRVDVAFTRQRLAVFVDGCFWHRCPLHCPYAPQANRTYWAAKLARNVTCDAEGDAALRSMGWEPHRIWERENPADAADEIGRRLRDRSLLGLRVSTPAAASAGRRRPRLRPSGR